MDRKTKLRSRRKKDTKFRISTNLCRKLRKEVTARLTGDNPTDFSAANFLVWLAAKKQIIRNDYHIDHIFPISKYDVKCPKQRNEVNSPYNLRWLKSEVNIKKSANPPNKEELEEHYQLVGEWINEAHQLNKIKLNSQI